MTFAINWTIGQKLTDQITQTVKKYKKYMTDNINSTF